MEFLDILFSPIGIMGGIIFTTIGTGIFWVVSSILYANEMNKIKYPTKFDKKWRKYFFKRLAEIKKVA